MDAERIEGRRRFTSRDALFLVLLSTGGAIFVLALEVVQYGWWGPGRAAERILTAFIASYCIGAPIGLGLLWLAPRLAGRRFSVRWASLVGMIAGGTLLGCALALLIVVTLGVRPRDFRTWLELPKDILFSLLVAFAFGISVHFYVVARDRLEKATLRLRLTELERERARKLAAEASLASLESRIHPHFLFNTLNSITGLIHEDPARAERLVERLAALLRFSLDSSARRVVTLEQELKIAADYLEIERARYGDRLRYAIEAPPELAAVEVPPLALQTLVENSVKHVAARRPGGVEIRIKARRERNRVHLEVRDDGPGFTRASVTPGHGLDNLSGRLRALFGDAAALEVSGGGGASCVRVSVPAPGAGS